MNTLHDLYEQIAHALQVHNFGTLEVTGRLSGWKTYRGGRAIAELVDGDPPAARLRVVASRPAATSAIGELEDHGRAPADTVPVTVYGHLKVDARWGLQFHLHRLRVTDNSVPVSDEPQHHPNKDTVWPPCVRTIGLVAPDGGDDARSDVLAHLSTTTVWVIEQRVPVTGDRAPLAICRALDRLALDPRCDVTLIVRGGGPVSDFSAFHSKLVLAAIDRHPRPVVTGLGHADTTTPADTAAHTSAITPTAAAQTVLTAANQGCW